MTNIPKDVQSLLDNGRGLQAEVTHSGSLRSLRHRDLMVSLFIGSEAEPGLANVYLRQLSQTPRATPLTGPLSPGRFLVEKDRLIASGLWGDLSYQAALVLDPVKAAWFWQIELENRGAVPIEFDLICLQDLALTSYGAIRLNEYYVSQYIDHTPLIHPVRGVVVASRQNLAVGGRNPWALLGSTRRAKSFSTDALQVFGHQSKDSRQFIGLVEGLPETRLQHEHALVGIQDQAAFLAPGEVARAGFYGWLLEDHPEATSSSDLAIVDEAVAAYEALPRSTRIPSGCGTSPNASLFVTAPVLETLDLLETDLSRHFGSDRRREEWHEGQLWSFFSDQRTHVVLKAKERVVLRPHGHLLRTGESFTTDESALTSTVWMSGVFHSMVTQGHVSINRFLSTTHSYLGLFNSHGLRLFVEVEGQWLRLGTPSCFAMEPDRCRWFYRHAGGLIEIQSTVEAGQHTLGLHYRIHEGPRTRVLMTLHVALGGDDGAAPQPLVHAREGRGVSVMVPEGSDLSGRFPAGKFLIQPTGATHFVDIGGDEWLYPEGSSRGEPFLCLITEAAEAGGLELNGALIESCRTPSAVTADQYWRRAVTGMHLPETEVEPLRHLVEILPWFAHNALIHFLSPRGLEQYSGGGWGTRDVAQGPVEYLLAINQTEAVRAMLLTLFQHQNPDGDWPQWFMFFERDRAIRPSDSHGDIVFWPLLALAQYLEATADETLLGESLPFFSLTPAAGALAPLREHVERALGLIRHRMIPGTFLESYGHGDWNDSLQPADPSLRDHLCSAWTVTLHYQTLATLARALGLVGETEFGARLALEAEQVLLGFRTSLVVDGVIPGYVNFETPEALGYLLHPHDHQTGLRFSLLPMVHAIINHMVSPEEAETHLALIKDCLWGPDGAHLFDQPMVYRGGPMRIFQRAETATFFGREIGLMYTHAHLRYAEALWQFGDAEGFFDALLRAVPTTLGDVIRSAAPRQSNCYFSSSDAEFHDRYEAYQHYDRVREGGVPLQGGWRVYSSGAGIAAGLIVRALFGLQATPRGLRLDPMLPSCVRHLSTVMDLYDHPVTVLYSRGKKGFGPRTATLNGHPLPLDFLANPYRAAAAWVPIQPILEALKPEHNELVIALG